jgi:hypothetical protein
MIRFVIPKKRYIQENEFSRNYERYLSPVVRIDAFDEKV